MDARRVLDSLRAGFLAKTGRALPVPFEPVWKFSDLPPELEASADRQHVGNAPKGAFFNSKIYLVEESHTSAADLENTIFHYLFSHG